MDLVIGVSQHSELFFEQLTDFPERTWGQSMSSISLKQKAIAGTVAKHIVIYEMHFGEYGVFEMERKIFMTPIHCLR